MKASDPNRSTQTVADPRGRKYRVVVARNGYSLREWSIAIDPLSLILEILFTLVRTWRAGSSNHFKVGVFRVNPYGYEPCIHKLEGIEGRDNADAAARRISRQIQIEGFPADAYR